MKFRFAVALIGLAISFALTTFAQQKHTVDPKVEQQIRALAQKYDEASNSHDAAAVAALYTEDGVRSFQNGTVHGRQAIEKDYARDFQRWPKRPGRQRGHPGAFRHQPEQIDEDIEVELCSCPHCGGQQFKDQSQSEQFINRDIAAIAIGAFAAPLLEKILPEFSAEQRSALILHAFDWGSPELAYRSGPTRRKSSWSVQAFATDLPGSDVIGPGLERMRQPFRLAGSMIKTSSAG
jgi:hypothetical protein